MSFSRQGGVVLVESLVATAMTFVVFGATLTLIEVFQSDNRLQLRRNETQDDERTALDRLSRELRNVAAPSAKTAGALEVARRYSMIFQTVTSAEGYSWGENAVHAIRVRYCLDNSNPTNELLWRQSISWKQREAPPLPTTTTCPDLTTGDWETTARLVEHVTNRIGGQSRPLFVYGPGSVALVSEITSLEVNLFTALKPGERPGESELASGISLRNANRPPTAFFTAQQLGAGRHVLLNASESKDPDGLALAYKWWQNGALLATTAQQYETPPAEKGSTQVFKLEVTDPGGLSSTYELSVEIK
jgi:hypothetical protein